MAVERHDAKKEECKKANNSSAPKREGLDGGSLYWAQESPQEAAVKSIKVKQQQVEMRLTSKMQEAADEDEAVAASRKHSNFTVHRINNIASTNFWLLFLHTNLFSFSPKNPKRLCCIIIINFPFCSQH